MSKISAIRQESLPIAKNLEKGMKRARYKYSLPATLLRFASQDSRLRTRLLELIDVLPALSSAQEVRDYLKIYLRDVDTADTPYAFKFAKKLLYGPFGTLEAKLTRYAVYKHLAPYFIVADTKELAKIRLLYKRDGCSLITDFLGEAVISEKESEAFFNAYKDAMERHGNQTKPFHIAVKLSALYPFFTPDNYYEGKNKAREKLVALLRIAKETNSFITVDAEHYALRNMVEDVFCEAVTHRLTRDYPNVGIALQAYLLDAPESAKRLIALAEARNTPFAVRLVKGAYWDTEVANAKQLSWQIPVFGTKEETDNSFEEIYLQLLEKWGSLYPVCASHNPYSVAFALAAAIRKDVGKNPNFSFQVLYGLGEPMRKVLVKLGIHVYVYVPVGNLTTGMAYFARRILENTSNEGFLLQLIKKEKPQKGGEA